MKYIVNKDYKAIFDEKTGFSVRFGINGDLFWKENGPELLDISITNFCEKGCDFCYRKSNQMGKTMDLALYKKIMSEAKSMGVFQVALGGGNPNQHPEFCEILKISSDYGIIPSYTTNGQGMSDDIYATTKRCAGAVAVSWYYPYEEAKKVIEKCNEYNIPVNIHFVLNNDNIPEVYRLLNDECIKKVNALIILTYKPVGNVQKNILRKSDKLSQLMERLITFQDCQIGFDSCMISHLVEKSELIEHYSIDYCEAGRFSAFISEEGLVYPCSFMCGAGDKGNSIEEKSLKDIWQNSSEFKKVRSEIKQRSIKCMECNYFELCRGGCPRFDINCK